MFEQLESRLLMSVAGASGTLQGISASQGKGGAVNVSTDNTYRSVQIVEAGTRNDNTGLVLATGGVGGVGVFDAAGDYIIFNGVTGSVGASSGSNGGNFFFDGKLHALSFNGSGGSNDVAVIDEGAGGSDVHCGGGRNSVQIVFSHQATIHDGGGTNDISINTDFDNAGGFGAVATGSTVTSGNGETIHLGNTASDYISIQTGGGTNTFIAYAGNIDVKSGGNDGTLLVQGTGTVTKKTVMTEYVDVLSYKGIDDIVLFDAA